VRTAKPRTAPELVRDRAPIIVPVFRPTLIVGVLEFIAHDTVVVVIIILVLVLAHTSSSCAL
jgi:hypothetical protein